MPCYGVGTEARLMGRADLLFFLRLSADVDEIDLSRLVLRQSKTSGPVFHVARVIGNRRLLSSLPVRLQASPNSVRLSRITLPVARILASRLPHF